MYQILLFTLLTLANANICSNSPLTIAELQQIRTNALTSLATWSSPNNLIPLNSNLDSTCNFTNSATYSHCGWPLAINPPCNSATTCTKFLGDNGFWQGQAVTNNLAAFRARSSQNFDPNYSWFQLNNYEAVVWLGCTPPTTGDVLGFSFTKNLYSNGNHSVTAHRRNGALGDSLNDKTLKVVSNDGTPFGGYTLIVYASIDTVRAKIISAFTAARSSTNKALSTASFNVDAFPTGWVNLGYGSSYDEFVLTARVNYHSSSPSYAAATAYASAVYSLFPYVHLTPTASISGNSLATYPVSAPDLDSTLWNAFNDEGVQQNNYFYTCLIQFQAPMESSIGGPVYTDTPFLVEDSAVKWIQEKQTGYWGTRDFLLYVSEGLQLTGSLGEMVVACGTDPSSSNWASAGTSAHSTFWTFSVFSTTNNQNAVTLFSSDIPSGGWNLWLGGWDPDNIGWCQMFSAPSNNGCYYATELGYPCIETNSNLDGSLRAEYRVYTDPNTGVAPSPSMILPPVVLVQRYY